MTTTRVFLVLIVALGLFFSAAFMMSGYPLVLRTSQVAEIELEYDSSTLNPLEACNIDEGSWSVYLIVHRDDYKDLVPELGPYKVWKVSSKEVLREIQTKWCFRRTGGDVATVSSLMIVEHDGKIIFQSGVVLDRVLCGIQSKRFGWAEPTHQAAFVDVLRKFRKVHSPIVFI